MFFPDFTLEHVAVPGGTIRLRRRGSGPPLLMLHGNPQTHAMWYAVAPALARRFSVVCPDLRGYGGSFKPGGDRRPRALRQAGDGAGLRRCNAASGPRKIHGR
jgi:haloacetate dehalogenase